MIAILYHSDIDIDDIAVFQLARVAGNTVTNYIVYRGADGAREAVVIERGGDRPLNLGDMPVADRIEFTRSHARPHLGSDHLKHFRRETASSPHLVDLFGGFGDCGHGFP